MSFYYRRRVLQIFIHVFLGELYHTVGAVECVVLGLNLRHHQRSKAVAQARSSHTPLALLRQQRIHAGIKSLCIKKRVHSNVELEKKTSNAMRKEVKRTENLAFSSLP